MNKTIAAVIGGLVAGFLLGLVVSPSSDNLGVKILSDRQTFLDGFDVDAGATLPTSAAGLNVTAGYTNVEEFSTGGGETALTDANGGTYTLTEAEMLAAGTFRAVASGAGQEVIALTFPATSTMTTLLPNAGDCRTWFYDASALAAATTTTMTAGTGHNLIAYTTNDDVIDGAEYAQIQMCRKTNSDVNTVVTELLNSD